MAAQKANTKKTGSWDLPLKVIKTGIVSWLIVFLFWGLGSLQYDEIFLPSPAETWAAIRELVSNGTLWADIAASVSRVLKGWGLAVVIAVPIGLVVGHFKPFRWIIEPILSLFRFIPAIALTSLFLMWFGVDDTSKVALILYAAFFQVLVNTIAGVVATDHSLMELHPVWAQPAESVFTVGTAFRSSEYLHRYPAGTQQQYHLCDRSRDAGWQ